MPLTRRVQVFISQEASEWLDRLVSMFDTQTAAIEYALMVANRQADADETPPHTILGGAESARFNRNGERIDSQPDTKLDRSTERIEDGEPGGSFASQWTKVIKETPRAKNPKPLERKQVVSIPKPGKKK